MGGSSEQNTIQCKECGAVSRRVDRLEAEMDHIKSTQMTSAHRFDSHMDKEEKMWGKFFEKLRTTEAHISEIVMRGMEDMMSLKELLRDEAEKAQKEMMAEISTIRRDFLSKQTAYIAVAVGAAVAGIMVFLFSTFTVDRVQANQTEQMKEMTKQLIEEIRSNP